MNRRLTLATLAVASVLAATAPAAHAQQDYPNKPIKLIVDGPAGGLNDMGTRRDANALSGILAKAGVYQVMTQPAFADFYRQKIAKWKKLSTDTDIRVEQ